MHICKVTTTIVTFYSSQHVYAYSVRVRQVKRMMQKTARRQLEQQMTDEQIQRERALQRSQLDAISRMVGSTVDVDDFGDADMFRQQLKMYME